MKKYYLILITILIHSCAYYKYIHRNRIEGYVYDSNGIPVANTTIVFVIEENEKGLVILSKNDSTLTDKQGYYYFDEISTIEKGVIGGERRKPFPLPYTFIAKKNGIIIDTINARLYANQKNEIKIDTLIAKVD
ncbi:hypothetical protein [Aquimarina aquimarini]|uniref:hypothetical protein n=1 Tax=Aquimarina aquimarini TaxID=1191734 RepID=UPI000D54FC83|nr:hypothetical protein [Aquimarina aquimarini]